jgi:hypothetical protein
VSKDGYTSVYVSKELKRQLVEIAQAADYEVGRGRGSRLAHFVERMLQAYSNLSQDDTTLPSLYTLIPELRSFVVKLSQMSKEQQRRACTMLGLLFDDQESRQGAQE